MNCFIEHLRRGEERLLRLDFDGEVTPLPDGEELTRRYMLRIIDDYDMMGMRPHTCYEWLRQRKRQEDSAELAHEERATTLLLDAYMQGRADAPKPGMPTLPSPGRFVQFYKQQEAVDKELQHCRYLHGSETTSDMFRAEEEALLFPDNPYGQTQLALLVRTIQWKEFRMLYAGAFATGRHIREKRRKESAGKPLKLAS